MRAAHLSLTLAFFAGCVSATGGSRILSIADIRVAPTRAGERIADYEHAVISIAAVMERDLRLPPVQGAIHFYSDREGFRAALEADGYTPDFAQDAAARLAGVGGFRRVLLNDATLRWLTWPQRVSLLAHELTHTLQYELSGGRRGTSEQWLREGFAEWVEVYVIDAFRFTRRDQARAIALERVRAGARRGLSVLSEMVTLRDWVTALQRLGEEALYAEALIAAEFLIERHSLPATLDYFRLFGESEDRTRNFRSAFGEDLSAFDAAFRADLARRLR